MFPQKNYIYWSLNFSEYNLLYNLNPQETEGDGIPQPLLRYKIKIYAFFKILPFLEKDTELNQLIYLFERSAVIDHLILVSFSRRGSTRNADATFCRTRPTYMVAAKGWTDEKMDAI